MKKILLSLGVIAGAFTSFSQVIVKGISPASIEGGYEFGVQASANWPSYTSSPSSDGENWGLTMDFRVNGTYVQDTLALAQDGTPGVNAQGIDSTYEACSPLINDDVKGKIALLYRNSCDFATKVKNAQDKGAVAVIVVNREDQTNFSMTANASGDGPNDTIPVILISKTDGDALKAEIESGEDVVMFIGNKYEVFSNDIGIDPAFTLISPFGGANTNFDNGFNLGVQLINFGSNDQTVAFAKVKITGPSGVVYHDSIIDLVMNSTDTIGVFDGLTNSLPAFSLSNYPIGEYTLEYTVGVKDSIDGDSKDNSQSFSFRVNDDVISRSTIDSQGKPIANTYPTHDESEYKSCMLIQDPNASVVGVTGVYFVPQADVSNGYSAVNEEIEVKVYEWADSWVQLGDENDPVTWNNDFDNPLSLTRYTITSDSELENAQFVELEDAVRFEDNKRYLVCLETYTPEINFGYDNTISYRGNTNVNRQPIGSLFSDNPQGGSRWFTGFISGIAPSISAILATDASIGENTVLEGSVAPNPATDMVRISVNSEGNATLVITDLSGKTVKTTPLKMNNGVGYVNVADLEDGMYIFNVTMENGQIAKINVVKK